MQRAIFRQEKIKYLELDLWANTLNFLLNPAVVGKLTEGSLGYTPKTWHEL